MQNGLPSLLAKLHLLPLVEVENRGLFAGKGKRGKEGGHGSILSSTNADRLSRRAPPFALCSAASPSSQSIFSHGLPVARPPAPVRDGAPFAQPPPRLGRRAPSSPPSPPRPMDDRLRISAPHSKLHLFSLLPSPFSGCVCDFCREAQPVRPLPSSLPSASVLSSSIVPRA